jgi:1-acyl-sn-glycerol-3-phosphate acyltransferase
MQIIAKFLRWLLTFRYTVEIKGQELLDKKNTYLVMPSHIALVDPLLLYSFLRKKIPLHPVVTKMFYNNLFLKPFFKWLGAVPVDEFDKDKGSTEDAAMMMQHVSDALTKGENVLLYPQGELAKQGYQSIIGKKTAFYAYQHAPKGTKYLMVNIRGLRGSRSSYAWNGKHPSMVRFLWKGLLFLLANVFVFTPKRKVSIQIFEVDEQLHQAAKGGLDIFNIQLEKIYNAQGEEQIHYVSGLRWYNTILHHHTPTKIEGALDTLRKKVDYSVLKYPKATFRFIEEKIRTIKPDYT